VLTVSHVCFFASEEVEKEKEDEAKKFLTYSPDGHKTGRRRGSEREEKRRIEKYLVSSSNRR
jgi:hypothetical protein